MSAISSWSNATPPSLVQALSLSKGQDETLPPLKRKPHEAFRGVDYQKKVGFLFCFKPFLGEAITPFTATLTFLPPQTATGTLVFEKDNPSGLPEFDQSISIPVRFAQVSTSSVAVKLYYPNGIRAEEIGDACSQDTIQPVDRLISITKTPIQDTIRLLIRGELTAREKAEGFTTEFPRQGFNLINANLRQGTLTLEFTEVPGFTTGGSCRVMLLAQQIIQTAKQFSDVKTVVLKPDSLFQP